MRKCSVPPDAAITMLKEGNARYVAHSLQHPNLGPDRRTETASRGQTPFATVLTCSDSRVPAEFIFDRGIGDIFVIRVAGNILGISELASVEYAVDQLGTPVFIVLGHTMCGAVTAVVHSGLLDGNLRILSEKILPAVEHTRHHNPGLAEDDLIIETVKANVWKTIEDAFKSSTCLRTHARNCAVSVLGAIYDSHTGLVDWMGSHPQQVSLIGYGSALRQVR